MGWTEYPDDTFRELLADRTRNQEWVTGAGDTIRDVLLRHCLVGSVLWKVWERTVTKPDGSTSVERILACDLLQRPSKTHGPAYKDLDESVGPGVVSCPLAYLDLVPEPPNKWAREWRQEVLAYHAERQRRIELGRSLVPGAVFRCKGRQPSTFTMDGKEGRYLLAYGPDGRRYRVLPQYVTDVEAA